MILLRPIWVHQPRPLRHRYTSLECRLSIWDEHRCDCLCKIKKLWRGGSIYGVVSFEEALSFGKVAVLVPLGGLGSGDLIWRLRTVVPLWRVPEFSCLLVMEFLGLGKVMLVFYTTNSVTCWFICSSVTPMFEEKVASHLCSGRNLSRLTGRF